MINIWQIVECHTSEEDLIITLARGGTLPHGRASLLPCCAAGAEQAAAVAAAAVAAVVAVAAAAENERTLIYEL